MTAFVVVNPTAGYGRGWLGLRAGLEALFPGMQVAMGRGRGEIASLVRRALQDGHLDIIAVGNGGTVNEAVNGFFTHGMTAPPDAVLGFISDGDLGRSFGGFAGSEAAIARLRKAHIRHVDVGRLSCLSFTGAPLTRYFLGAASFGLSGRIAQRGNSARWGTLFGRRFANSLQTRLALTGWRSPRLRLMADGGQDEIAGITLVAVANGGWCGHGLNIAPDADPADGFFDIAVVGGASRRRAWEWLKAIREGRPLSDPDMRRMRARRLTAAPILETIGPVAIETDGESVGLLPATFEILPNALNLRC